MLRLAHASIWVGKSNINTTKLSRLSGYRAIHFRVVFRVIGVLLLLLGAFMLLPLVVGLLMQADDWRSFVYSICCCVGVGLPLFFIKVDAPRIGKREGYLIVALGWLILCLAAAMPYLFNGTITTFSSAIFESTSGLTTTGASVLTDIEAVSKGMLFWRSLTQWIGGMGIIVLTVAIFPILGIGGVELFVAEAPGPTSDKIHPRIKETAKRLWLIYVGLTILLALILFFVSGMTAYDAINHALTTMSTGGFSTKNASVAAYPAIVQYPILIFMFLAGMNYTVIYFGLMGKFKKVWSSDEFKFYLLCIVGLCVVVSLTVFYNTNLPFEQAFRDSAFQIVSIITTTGYVSADYTTWHNGITLLFFMLLFGGACAGSTSGGIKMIRHLVFFKNSVLEFKRLLHPKAVIRIKIDRKVVSGHIITHILVFLMVYLILFAIGSVVMIVLLGNDDQPILTAIGSVATSLGNVGPAIGNVGPVDNFAFIPEVGKLWLCLLMIIGRLELFTFLIVFSPYYWRAN